MSKRFWFWVILALGFALRLYGITNPLLDNHAWRQADTASMAANFLQHGFFPPFPQLNYDGPPPNYVELEFPIVPLITAALWRVFGQMDILARGVVIVFSTLTMAFIYLLGKELYDRKSGLLAMTFFALNPLAIYFGRTVMPDSAMIFFMTVTVYFMVRWAKTGHQTDLLWSALTFACAILAKLPALMMGAPLMVPLMMRYRTKIFRERTVWLFLAIALIPPGIYYVLAHLRVQAVDRYVSGIMQSQMNLTLYGFDYLKKTVKKLVTYPLILPALTAPFLRKAKAGNSLLWVWLGVLFVYTIAVCARIQLDYYLFPLIPLLSVLAGGAVGLFWGEAPGVISGLLIFLLCANLIPQGLKNFYQVNYPILDQAKVIEKYTGPGDLLVLDDEQPMTLYYSDRQGWRLLPGQQNPQALESLHSQGAKIFVVLPGSKLNPVLKSYLDTHYNFVPQGAFYDLRLAKG